WYIVYYSYSLTWSLSTHGSRTRKPGYSKLDSPHLGYHAFTPYQAVFSNAITVLIQVGSNFLPIMQRVEA
ncbi:hypothetical protein, partial [Aeribacillus pallidus]|uniref:hypothetical protein n=1 Tax=Aeribacillus pallidus TaxID=33936 RepID=UPI003D1BCF94